jgi:exopolysaccharide biosynthesis polyprenyl glycosylphosphotransferase
VTFHKETLATAEPLSVLAVPPRPWITPRTARALALAGRAGVVWLPAYALVTGQGDGLPYSLQTSVAVAAIWLAAMRGSFAAGRLTLSPLGPPVAAAVGSASGLVAVAALDPVLLHLPPLTLAQIAVAVFLLTAVWESVVSHSVVAKRRVLVVGAAGDLAAELRTAEWSRFEVAAVVREEDIDSLPEALESTRPDLVVLAVRERRSVAFEYLLDAASSGFRVVGLPEFYEHAFGRVPVATLTPAWFMSVLHLYQRPYSRLVKRGFDVAVASLGLVLTAPLFPVLALLVKRTGGPVIFRQTRLGEGGKPFTIFKFRTMRQDAEAEGRATWASVSDPRITPVGRFLRKARLDELPQLWNVLRGDMSIVGPRPERPEFLELLREVVPFWSRRHLVKPGLTGWAQVSRGYTADAEGTAEKLSYDLWYLRHRSLVVDLAICGKTFGTLVTGSGAR